MSAGDSNRVTRSEIESLLQQIMVPVDPDEKFVKRLQAKLVRVEGGALSTGWAIIGAVAIATVVLMTIFGFALRLFLSLLSLIGLLERRTNNGPRKQVSTAS